MTMTIRVARDSDGNWELSKGSSNVRATFVVGERDAAGIAAALLSRGGEPVEFVAQDTR